MRLTMRHHTAGGRRAERSRLKCLQSGVDLALGPDCHLLSVTPGDAANLSQPIFLTYYVEIIIVPALSL